MTIFRQRMKARREELGLTQEQLSERSGVNLRKLQRVEEGTFPPKLDVAIDLAIGLDTSVEYLSGQTEDKRPVLNYEDLSIAEKIAVLLKLGDKVGAIRLITDHEPGDAPGNLKSQK